MDKSGLAHGSSCPLSFYPAERARRRDKVGLMSHFQMVGERCCVLCCSCFGGTEGGAHGSQALREPVCLWPGSTGGYSVLQLNLWRCEPSPVSPTHCGGGGCVCGVLHLHRDSFQPLSEPLDRTRVLFNLLFS